MNRTIKVVHITTVHPALDTRIFHKELKSLSKAGFNTYLISVYNQNTIKDNIKIISLPKPRNRIERFLKTGFLAYKKALEEKADIYHFHDPELLPWMVKLKQQTKSIVIYDAHEDLPSQIYNKYYIPIPLRKIISEITKFLENHLSKKLDFIVAATPHIKEKFTKIGCRSLDVNNYPSLEEFSDITHNWKSKENLICYIGTVSKIRGIYQIIEACKKLNVKLIIAGPFDNPKIQKDISQIIENNPKIEYRGNLDRKEVKQLLSICIAGLVIFFPIQNHIYSKPIKLFEYLAAELPVIASNFPLWKEIIENNRCGICVNPFDTEEIRKAIEFLISNPDEAQKMGKRGRKLVMEKYNWERESQKLINLYHQLLSSL